MSTQFQDTLKDSMDKLNIIAAKKGALVKTQTPVAFLSATCYLDGDNAVVSFNAFKNMKKELAKMDMSKQEVKDYIETFDQNVSKAMKTIKENFNKD